MCLSVKSKSTQPINPALGIEPTPHTSTATTAENATNPAGEIAASAPDGSVPASTTQAAVEPTKPQEPVAPAANDTVGENYKIEHDNGQGTRVTGKQKLGGTYSIQFYIRDANGAICDGMYYTIKVVGTKELIKGKTGKEGRTERVFSDTANDIAYLYIGHRQEKFDKLPTSRAANDDNPNIHLTKSKEDQNKKFHTYEETILNSASTDDQTMAPVAEKKLRRIDTARLWKVWKTAPNGKAYQTWERSEKGLHHTMVAEELRLNLYDNDGGKPGNVTIGVGEKIHDGPFVMNQARVNQVVTYLKDRKMSVTINNIVSNLETATGLSGTDLEKAKKEMRFVNGYANEDTPKQRYRDKLYEDHRRQLPKHIFVPLYQNEYDALADLSYNSGEYRITPKNSKIAAALNRGGYKDAGDSMYKYSDKERKKTRRLLYFDNEYITKDLNPRKYNHNSEESRKKGTVTQPPWLHIELD